MRTHPLLALLLIAAAPAPAQNLLQQNGWRPGPLNPGLISNLQTQGRLSFSPNCQVQVSHLTIAGTGVSRSSGRRHG